MKHDLVLILDFGGQYTQLVAEKIRECHVYCQIKPFNTNIDEIIQLKPKTIILSGSKNNVNSDIYHSLKKEFWDKINVPILAIDYGMHIMVESNGGIITKNYSMEFGKVDICLNNQIDLFCDIKPNQKCWMSHNDTITDIGNEFKLIASTTNCKFAAVKHINKKWYGVQFHPEIIHTPFGKQMFSNFLFLVSDINPTWETKTIIDDQIMKIKETIKDKKAICIINSKLTTLVTASLVSKAIGDNLLCLFIDHGMHMKNEKWKVYNIANKIGLHVKFINVEQLFLNQLKNINDFKTKRKIINNLYAKVFEKINDELDTNYQFLINDIICPDFINDNHQDNLINLYNHDDFQSNVNFELIEPLKELYNNEVKNIGLLLGLPIDDIYQQPLLNYELSSRIIGEITKEKIDVLKEADYIFNTKLLQSCEKLPYQYFAIILNSKKIDTYNENQIHGYTICLKAIDTDDLINYEWSKIDFNLLAEISFLITSKLPKVNHVVYDITNKPYEIIKLE